MRNDEGQENAPTPSEPEVVAAPPGVTEPVPGMRAKPLPPAFAGDGDPRIRLLLIASAVLLATTLLFGLIAFAPALSPIKSGAVRSAAREQTGAEVERSAARFAAALYTFSYKTIDEDIERIRDGATGDYKEELDEALGDVDVLVDAQGESSGEIVGVDARRVSGDSAIVRVFVLQSISNRSTQEPRRQFSSVDLSLVNTTDGWKVTALKPLLRLDSPAIAAGL